MVQNTELLQTFEEIFSLYLKKTLKGFWRFKHKKNPLGKIVTEKLNGQEVIKEKINRLGHIAGPPRSGHVTKRMDVEGNQMI